MNRLKIFAISICLVAGLSCLLTGCTSEYTPQAKEQTVPAEALQKDGVLRVGVDTNSAPMAGQTASSSQIVGIDIDIAAALADNMGVKLEVVDVGKNAESALSNGTVDIVMGVMDSEEDASYWTSAPYLGTGVALFAPSAQTAIPTPDSHPKIAAQVSSKSSWRVTNLFDSDSLVVKNDLKDAFAALGDGSAQYVAADAIIGQYVVETNGFDAKIIAMMQDPSGYCIAVSSSNKLMQTAITDSLDSIVSGGIAQIIQSKWLGDIPDFSTITVIKSDHSATETEDTTIAEASGESDGQPVGETGSNAVQPNQNQTA